MRIENQLFSQTELKSLTPIKTQALSNTILKQKIDKFILSAIKANAGNGLPMWGQLLQKLRIHQVSTIKPTLIPLFTSNDLMLYAFSKTQMKALTKKQIQEFTPEQIKYFSYNKFSLLERGIRKIAKN